MNTASSPRIDAWFKKAVRRLEKAGIGTARLDAFVLLSDALKRDKAYILAHPEQMLTLQQLQNLKTRVDRRAKHEPLAYIRGKTEFYGRNFLVDQRVLEPRPETETMIDLLKRLRALPARPALCDIGCGSGAIGITAMLELPAAHVDMYDNDPKTLVVARKNAKHYGVRVNIYKNDLLSGVSKRYDVVLANLPYVPDNFTLNKAAMNEPKNAIFGGKDGLDVYRRLFEQLSRRPSKFVFTEALPFQHKYLAAIAKKAGYKLVKADDFVQLFKAVL